MSEPLKLKAVPIFYGFSLVDAGNVLMREAARRCGIGPVVQIGGGEATWDSSRGTVTVQAMVFVEDKKEETP